MMQRVARKIAVATIGILAGCAARGDASPSFQWLDYRDDGLALKAQIYRPAGPGPFPTLVWNHGSEQAPGVGPFLPALAARFNAAGWLVFVPLRRGHGYSAGEYIVDQQQAAALAGGQDAENRLQVRLLETEQLDDQLAGLAALRRTGLADPARTVVAGCSYGGIETLLAAERGAGYAAAVALSPAAMSWDGNPLLQARLRQAVDHLRIPTLLLQPAGDDSLAPATELGAEARRANRPLQTRIFPATGPAAAQRHCFGGAEGIEVWADTALDFFQRQLDAAGAR